MQLFQSNKSFLRNEVQGRKQGHDTVTCHALVAWCQEQFNFSHAPGKSTISGVLKSTNANVPERD